MVSTKGYCQDLPLGEGAPACRGERGQRDAMIHSDIPGEMVRCTDSPQNVREITAYCGPLQSCFARQLPPREAFGGYITFWHSTYPVPYPTWVGRMISSPTVTVLKRHRAGQGSCRIHANLKCVMKQPGHGLDWERTRASLKYECF